MITAIVFIKADVARIPEIAEEIAAIEGVSEVYSVTGDIDLIALLRVRQHDDIARFQMHDPFLHVERPICEPIGV